MTRCAEQPSVNGAARGPALLTLTSMWEDLQQARKAADQRGLDPISAELLRVEQQTAREILKHLRKHPVWPWLSRFPGLGGVHTARIVAIIGDSRRFPGQMCSIGHHAAPDFAAGDSCPFVSRDGESCPGTMLAPRPGTGTRSLWHYFGLHVVDGRSPRKTKGVRADWNTKARTAVMQPGGIAEQIVRLRVPVYREVYDEARERLQSRADRMVEIETHAGPAIHAAEAASGSEIEATSGLRPFQIDAIARKVAAKRFLADLLRELKRLAAEVIGEDEVFAGGEPIPTPGAEILLEREMRNGTGDIQPGGAEGPGVTDSRGGPAREAAA